MRKNLFIYLTLGYPDNDILASFISQMEKGIVDGIEFGLPSRDPRYDGPKIRLTHKRIDLPEFSGFSEIFEKSDNICNRKIALSYYSDLSRDLDGYISFMKTYGITEVIVPDMLIDFPSSIDQTVKKLADSGISFIPFFNAATPDSVIRRVLSITKSWIYYGLQPSTGINMPFNVDSVAARAMEVCAGRSVIFGFGIRNRSDILAILKHGGDGVAIGSALIDDISSHNFTAAYQKIKEFREALDSVI